MTCRLCRYFAPPSQKDVHATLLAALSSPLSPQSPSYPANDVHFKPVERLPSFTPRSQAASRAPTALHFDRGTSATAPLRAWRSIVDATMSGSHARVGGVFNHGVGKGADVGRTQSRIAESAATPPPNPFAMLRQHVRATGPSTPLRRSDLCRCFRTVRIPTSALFSTHRKSGFCVYHPCRSTNLRARARNPRNPARERRVGPR